MRLAASLLLALLCLAPVTLALADDEVELVRTKVTKLVDQKFGGDWDRVYKHYARLGEAGGERMEPSELRTLLKDAGVELEQARVLKLLDKNDDKIISKTELKWTDHNSHDPGTTLAD